jgi:hypothetical protein
VDREVQQQHVMKTLSDGATAKMGVQSRESGVHLGCVITLRASPCYLKISASIHGFSDTAATVPRMPAEKQQLPTSKSTLSAQLRTAVEEVLVYSSVEVACCGT